MIPAVVICLRFSHVFRHEVDLVEVHELSPES